MGSVVAISSAGSEDLSAPLARMLKALEHRGAEYGIADPSGILFPADPEDLIGIGPRAMGHNFKRILPGDSPQPISAGGDPIAFDGRIFSPECRGGIGELLGGGRLERFERLLAQAEGAYAFAALCGDSLILGRDPLGLKPLYFGRGDGIFAAASEAKALWAIGIANAESFPPGSICVVEGDRPIFRRVRGIERRRIERLGIGDAKARLRELMERSLKIRLRDVDRIAMAFSGGLDSSIVARMASAIGKEVLLISTSLRGSGELGFAKWAAGEIGAELIQIEKGPEDIWKDLRRVLWLIEDPDPMKAAIGIPLHWVLEEASALGFAVALTGQGADECFGGYMKALRALRSGGPRLARKLLFEGIRNSHLVNFERDEKISSASSLELRAPFADTGIVGFALSLPMRLILDAERGERKVLLRALAKEIGLPDPIASRPKRAIQYSTGVNRALAAIARDMGRALPELLREEFEAIFGQSARIIPPHREGGRESSK
ncbi:MAG: asparagine synthase-related protein [Candidatus Bathyarchaeia archaeon]